MLSDFKFLSVAHDQAHVPLEELLVHEGQFLGPAVLIRAASSARPDADGGGALERRRESIVPLRQDGRCAGEALNVPLNIRRRHHITAAACRDRPLQNWRLRRVAVPTPGSRSCFFEPALKLPRPFFTFLELNLQRVVRALQFGCAVVSFGERLFEAVP